MDRIYGIFFAGMIFLQGWIDGMGQYRWLRAGRV